MYRLSLLFAIGALLFGLLTLVVAIDGLVFVSPGSDLYKLALLIAIGGVIVINRYIYKRTNDFGIVPLNVLFFCCMAAVFYLFIK